MNGPLLGRAELEHAPPSYYRSERDPFIHKIGAFHSLNWNDPILWFYCHQTITHSFRRPLAEEKKVKEQNYNKPPKKGTDKGKQNKILIYNTQCQITNPLRYNNISKWEEFKNNSCSLSGDRKNYGSFFKKVKKRYSCSLDAMGTPSQKGSAFVRGQQSCHGDRRAPTKEAWPKGTNQERGDKMDAPYEKPGKEERGSVFSGLTFEESTSF